MIDGYDGVPSLRVGSVDVPAPGGGQIRVRVSAAGVGPWDVLTTEGAFAEVLGGSGHAAFPLVLGWDFAGVVVDAGPGSDLRPGERVFGMTRQPIDGIGCHAELVTVMADRCVRVPDRVSDEQAASLPCCGLTAWQALDRSGARDGDTLLVIGAVGQLGGLVTQLAAGRGVRVIASVSSAQAATARRLGAAETVDRDGDLADQVRALIADGVDAAFDPVGVPVGPAIRDGGRFVRAVTWSPEVTERGITTHTLFVEDDRESLRGLGAMLERGALTARVGDSFPLERGAPGLRGGPRRRLRRQGPPGPCALSLTCGRAPLHHFAGDRDERVATRVGARSDPGQRGAAPRQPLDPHLHHLGMREGDSRPSDVRCTISPRPTMAISSTIVAGAAHDARAGRRSASAPERWPSPSPAAARAAPPPARRQGPPRPPLRVRPAGASGERRARALRRTAPDRPRCPPARAEAAPPRGARDRSATARARR